METLVVATGNSVGKSYLAAGLILWWLFTRPGSQVSITAPSQTLLGTVLFKEVQRAFLDARRAGVPLPGKVTDSPSVSPQTITIGDWGRGLGLSTRGVERLSGQHNANLMALVDEASGLLPSAWEALRSQNPKKMVVFGNPLAPHTHFHKMHSNAAASLSPMSPEAAATVSRFTADAALANATEDKPVSVSVRMPSWASPDIGLPHSPRGLADGKFLRNAEVEWPRGTPLWDGHVEGIFPISATHALMEAWWLDRCRDAQPDGETVPHNWASMGPWWLIADIAAGVGRDRTVILVRNDWGLVHFVASARMGLAECAQQMSTLSRQWNIGPDRIAYDAGGIGRDLDDYLRPYGLHLARRYHGSESGGVDFINARARLAWSLRERLDPSHVILPPPVVPHEWAPSRQRLPWERDDPPPEISLPPMKQQPFFMPADVIGEHWSSLREELLALQYRMVGSKIALQEKAELAKKLGRSPDLADTLIMSMLYA